MLKYIFVFFILSCPYQKIQASWDIDPLKNQSEVKQNKQSTLEIPSGKGKIIIDLTTGIVEYYQTDLNEASFEFWNHIMMTYPWIKRSIIREYFLRKREITERTR